MTPGTGDSTTQYPPATNLPVSPTTTSSSTMITTTLQLGSSGPEVLLLQNILSAKGWPVSVTGNFDQATKDAVILFQKTSNISPADGAVGPMTRAMINAGNVMIMPSIPTNPITTNPVSANPTISIISPNGGSYVAGSSMTINWNLTGAKNTTYPNYQVLLKSNPAQILGVGLQQNEVSYSLKSNNSGQLGYPFFTVQLPSDISCAGFGRGSPDCGFVPGNYYIEIDLSSSPYMTNPIVITSNAFTVASSNSVRPPSSTTTTSSPVTATPTPTTPKNSCPQTLTIGGTTYTISPCSINLSMIDGQGDKNFSVTITATGANTSFGYSTLGYGVGFPTYGILGGGSGGVNGSTTLNLHLSDAYLSADGNQPKSYVGYLPVHIFQGNETGSDGNFLNINVNATVNPAI